MIKPFLKPSALVRVLFLGTLLVWATTSARAQFLDTIGVTLLRATTTNLDGSGMTIADAEASTSTTNNAWEVSPSDPGINLPVSDFTWYDSPVPVTTFPNPIGTDSWHSDIVGSYWYGPLNGISTNVAHIQNIEANYYFTAAVPSSVQFTAKVVNQSFTAGLTQQTSSDTAYDNYAAKYHTLFVSAAGNGGTVAPPSTSYNGLSVGAYLAGSSTGPTADNGRAKPDLCAPAGATSFSAPQVAGAATLLLQAGFRGDGGADTNSATDIRTVKALLLNGAVKPANWANPAPSPLDPLYGAGVLNVFNSYHQLIGGKRAYIATSSLITNNPHPPTGAPGNLPVLSGWDLNSLTNDSSHDAVNHYCFSVTNSAGNGPFTATMTLVWNRHTNQTSINDLDLFVYDMTTSNLIAASTSTVDNVEHIFVPQLPPGRYDVEVLKHGGPFVSASENYALAFDFFAAPITATPVAGGVKITWPLYPAGFQLQSNNNLASPGAWTTIANAPAITNNQNTITINTAGLPLYFRLIRSP